MFTVSLPPPMIDTGAEEDVFRTLMVLAPPPARMDDRLDLAEGEREGLAVLGDHHAVFGVQVDGDVVGVVGTELVAGDDEVARW